MTTALDVAKEALAQIGTRSTIVSLTDGSAEATYINLLYNPIRDFLLTEGDWDFSFVVTGITVVSPPPVLPWRFAYVYPVDALRIRQLLPKDYDALDPRPVEWTTTSTFGQRQINTREEVVQIHYTRAAAEDVWDGIFREAFVRMLASALAFALENRIEASKVKLDEALGFAGIAKVRDM
jgi:hypothetical protein